MLEEQTAYFKDLGLKVEERDKKPDYFVINCPIPVTPTVKRLLGLAVKFAIERGDECLTTDHINLASSCLYDETLSKKATVGPT